MADVVVIEVVKEAVRGCFQGIGHHISYIRKYKVNINNLKVELKKLEDSERTVVADVRTAENNAQDIKPIVIGWQQTCLELITKANDFSKNEMSFHVNCLCCNCPNLKSRYLASKAAAEIVSLITRHLEQCTFDSVGHYPQLGMLPLVPPGIFDGLGSRMVIMEEVMESLQNDSISVIGLCGMGGIGKTTMVKEIAEKVKKEKLFDEVAFVVVPRDQNVKAIQDQLASRLGLKDIGNEFDIHGRAQLLYRRLMNEKKTILVILDDVWEELDLHSVGIPIHGDRHGFKILLTSRFDSVCTNMKVQKRLEVGILPKEEAWNLFKMTADNSDESVSHIAQEVTQECAGLPLAIVMVAESLRCKDEHAFRNVLRQLRDPVRSNTLRVPDKLYKCIKSSYDYLDSDDHRLLLSLCSLFPEGYDIPMEDLVRYARALFETCETMAEVRDRVEDIIDDLMKCYLLLQGEIRKCVKLHDVVRDMCISIASKSDDVHISSKFDGLKNKLVGMDYQRLRLLRMINEEYFWKSAFPSGPLMLNNTLNLELPISGEMQELRVLEVNHITTRVPSSLKFMIKLQTLSLDYCRLDGDFAGIKSLTMLRVLSFFHSIVEIFPTEIAELTNLQCLDLRFNLKHPSTFLWWTLTNLKELEELYLGNIVSLDVESLKEGLLSSKLHTIQFVVADDSCLEGLLRNLNLSKLVRFHIARDQEEGGEIEYQIRQNVLELHQKSVDTDLNLLKELMKRVDWFYLNGRLSTHDVLGEDNRFQNVKDLKLRNCDMKYLVDANDHFAKGNFSILETLRIHSAEKLEELIHGDNPRGTLTGLSEVRLGNLNVGGSFQSPLGHLTRLEIFQCGKIKTLFSKFMVNCLGRLEYMEIKFCNMFERIVRIQKDDEVDSQVSEFPKLKHLTLFDLPEFQDLGYLSDQVMLSKLEHLTIMLYDTHRKNKRVGELCSYLGSSIPKVRYLDITNCDNLLTIATSGLVHGFEDLQTLQVRLCLFLEVVFGFEEIMGHLGAETPAANLLARLEELDLSDLPRLKHICTMVPEGTPVFSNLKKIQVNGCDNLRYLLAPSMKMLVHLEELKLLNNKSMEAIIGSDEKYMPNDGEEILLESFILPKLKFLTIERIPSLTKLSCCSPKLILELTSLDKLEITFMVQDMFTIDQISRLTSLSIGRIGNLKYSITPSSAKLLVSVRELKLSYDEQIEAIFGSDEHGGDNFRNMSIALPRLRKITVHNLRNLEKLCLYPDLNLELPLFTELHIINCPVDIITREHHALQNLRKIRVEKCDSFYCLLRSVGQVLVHLGELELYDNHSIYSIFGDPIPKSKGEKNPTRSIVLLKLRKLVISNLRNFRMLCWSENLNVELPSLAELYIGSCPQMNQPCVGKLSAPHLISVIYYGKEIALELKDCESMTRCLYCIYDGNYCTCEHFEEDRKAAANRNARRQNHGRSNSDEGTNEYLHSAYSSLAYTSGARSTDPLSALAPSIGSSSICSSSIGSRSII